MLCQLPIYKELNPLNSESRFADLFLELFMDCVQCILDRHSFQVSCSDFEPQRKVQVNLLDRRFGKVLLEYVFVFQCSWRCVQPPGDGQSWLTSAFVVSYPRCWESQR